MIAYFDSLIAARRDSVISEHVHLGLFDDSLPDQTLDEAQAAMSLLHLAHLEAHERDTIVDIGCGFGGTLRVLDATMRPINLIGVNVDPRQIELAKAEPWRNPVIWDICDAAHFSTDRRNWVDRILSLEALFHFPDPAGFLNACASALRPGGRLVFSTISLAGSQTTPDISAAIQTVCRGFAPWPFPDMGNEDLCSLAKAAGLELRLTQDISTRCLRGFDWMAPPCPPQITDNPVIELRRLFENGRARYLLFVLDKPMAVQTGGKTQK